MSTSFHRNLWFLSLGLLFGLAFLGCEELSSDFEPEPEPRDLMRFRVNPADSLSILEEALERTGLNDTVQTKDRITLFAPTNEAFERFFASRPGISSIDDFNTDEEVDELRTILNYHILQGRLPSAGLVSGYTRTLATDSEDNQLSIYFLREGIPIINNFAPVLDTDVVASNGLMHVIGEVLTPPTITTFLRADSRNFAPFLDFISRDDLPDYPSILSATTNSPFTIFAPISSAFPPFFSRNPEWEDVNDIPLNQLNRLIQGHIVQSNTLSLVNVAGSYPASRNINGDPLTVIIPSASGALADLLTPTDTLQVVFVNIHATNGVIHVINEIINP